VTAALTLSAAAHADSTFQPNARNIPETLPHIPEAYMQPAEQQGQLVRLDYDTWESFTYDEQEQRLTKTAWVYLPYGYTPEERYNIFYYMHGGWSNETSTLGTDAQPTPFKHAIDHAIQDGLMQPMIIVCPTYNNTSGEDSGNYSLALQLTDRYHNELVNDLLPAVESRYSTWAEATTPEGLRASRDHRGFGGFSMGSVTTWHTFQYCLDYFRYFMPMSGNMGDGGWAAEAVRASGWTPEDFFIFTATGTEDFAGTAFTMQIDSMATRYGDVFHLADNERDGNLSFRLREGGTHGGRDAMDYSFAGLCWFWHGE
ncbi:MAG: alpha/beta hydrolase, partial [Aristaeellaceae bacterium]